MPARRHESGKIKPVEWALKAPVGKAWLKAKLAADAPPAVHYAQRLAINLQEAMTDLGMSARALGRAAEMSDATVGAILAGENWPDLWTIARLEVALDREIWPGNDVLGGK